MTLDEADEPILRFPAGYALAVATLLGLGIALSTAVIPPRWSPVDVRFCNETGALLSHVVTSGARFGDIPAGACSSYRRIERGYTHMGFGADFRGVRIEQWAEDHIGEPDLTAGHQSFVIVDTPNGLDLRLRR